jgi:phosphatidylserine/phosphatidylglycerophosphate/cardiolipin synthase-like enzyme
VAILTLSPGTEDVGIQVINDRDYYPAVKELFEEADDSIHIVLYGSKYYTFDSRGDNVQVNSLLEELGEAAERGVDVKVVFDESWDGIVDTAIHLKSLGVDVVFDKKGKTTHSKFIVMDGKIVVVGSTNWSYSALQKNHEANVLIHSSEIASEYEDYFDEIWDGD